MPRKLWIGFMCAALALVPLVAQAIEPQTDAGIKAKYSQSYASPPIKVIYTPDTPANYPQMVAAFLKNDLKVRNRTTCAVGPVDDGKGGIMVRIPARWDAAQITAPIQAQLKKVAQLLSVRLKTRVLLVMVKAGSNRETFRTSS
ncbi:MAG: hypothetical protein KJ621_09915 [Proteobacteria bacterium]|nr:hypothetical protein [Pseudomonadota bacterium]MBU1741191.1 hypothetical protein [Pseudomonadota bacterium]